MVPATVARRAFLGDLTGTGLRPTAASGSSISRIRARAANFDGAVQIAIRPERIHAIAEAGS